MNDTTQNTVLITGCSSGFGNLAATLFASRGWKVYGTVRDTSNPVVKDLTQKGIIVLAMDITKDQDIQRVVTQILSESGKIDVLVNNAGAGFVGPVEDFSSDELHEQFNVNFFGVHQLIKAVLPGMREQNSGRIINISSMAGRSTTALYGAYSATKFALEAMSEALNLEVSKWNISVSLVEPGSFATKFGTNIKLPSASTSDSPYKELIEYNKGVRSHLDSGRKLLNYFRNPQRVADLIYKIAISHKPRLHYPIGLDARGIILVTSIIPYSVRKFLLKFVYRW